MSGLIYADIEAQVIAHLDGLMPDVIVADEVPNPRPESAFVTVVRTGGAQVLSIVEGPVLDIECWAQSNVAACDLAREVKSHLAAIPPGNRPGIPAQIHDVITMGGPTRLPDPRSTQARYVMKIQVNLRAELRKPS